MELIGILPTRCKFPKGQLVLKEFFITHFSKRAETLFGERSKNNREIEKNFMNRYQLFIVFYREILHPLYSI